MSRLIVLSCLFGFALCHPGWNKSGMGGKWMGRGGRGMMPPFLQNVTEQQRNDFFNIVKNQNLTKAEIKTQTEQWASNIGGTVQSTFTEFEANMTRFKQEAQQNRTRILGELAGQLQTLQSIIDDQTITRTQERQQIRNFYQNLSDHNLARAVKFMSMIGMKPHWGGRRGGSMWGGKMNKFSRMGNKMAPMGMGMGSDEQQEDDNQDNDF